MPRIAVMPLQKQKYSYTFRMQSANVNDGDEPDKAELQADVFAILGIKEKDREETY
jgi:hypothetical protein